MMTAFKRTLLWLFYALGFLIFAMFLALQWFASSPAQAIDWFEDQTGIFIDYRQLDIRLDYHQLRLDVHDLLVQQPGQWKLEANGFTTTLNWVSVWIPGTYLGEDLRLKTPILSVYQGVENQSHSADEPVSSSSGDGVNWLRGWFASGHKLWKNIKVTDGHVRITTENVAEQWLIEHIYLDSFHGYDWRTKGQFVLNNSLWTATEPLQFSLSGVSTFDHLGFLSRSDYRIATINDIPLSRLRDRLPADMLAYVPQGFLSLQLHMSAQSTQLEPLVILAELDQLRWSKTVKNAPNYLATQWQWMWSHTASNPASTLMSWQNTPSEKPLDGWQLAFTQWRTGVSEDWVNRNVWKLTQHANQMDWLLSFDQLDLHWLQTWVMPFVTSDDSQTISDFLDQSKQLTLTDGEVILGVTDATMADNKLGLKQAQWKLSAWEWQSNNQPQQNWRLQDVNVRWQPDQLVIDWPTEQRFQYAPYLPHPWALLPSQLVILPPDEPPTLPEKTMTVETTDISADTLQLPNIPMQTETSWRLKTDGLSLVQLETLEQTLSGRWSADHRLDVRFNQWQWQEDLQLSAFIRASNLNLIRQNLPYALFRPSLTQWMNQSRLDSGETVEIAVKLDGTDRLDQLMIDLTTKDVPLNFSAHWPDAHLHDLNMSYQNDRLTITSHQGQLDALSVGLTTAVFDDLLTSDDLTLFVSTQAQADLAQIRQLLIHSPVAERLGIDNALKKSDVASQIAPAQVQLMLPVNHVEDFQLQGQWTLNQGRWQLGERVALTQLQGEIQFTDQSLNVDTLNGQWRQAPFHGSVKTEQQQTIVINVQTEQDFHWLDDSIQGQIPLHMQLQIPYDAGERPRYQVYSNLMGLSSDLPEPFTKSAQDAWDMSIQGQFYPQWIDWNVVLKDKGSAQGVILTADEMLADSPVRADQTGIIIRLNEALPPKQQPVSYPANDWYRIEGYVDTLNAQAWMDWLQQRPTSNESRAIWIDNSQLKIKQAVGYGVQIQDVQAQIHTREANVYDWQVQGDMALGSGYYDANNQTFFGQFDRLLLEEKTAVERSSDEAQQRYQACLDEEKNKTIDDAWPLPEFSVTADQMTYKNMQLGAVTVEAGYLPSGQYQLDMNLRQQTAHGQVLVTQNVPANQLDIQGRVVADSTDDFSRLLGVPGVFKGKSIQVPFDLTQAAPLVCFDIAHVTGVLDIDAQKGSITKADPGIARLLGLLNLSQIVRRVSLNLSDVAAEGFYYDEMKGQLQFKQGQFHFRPLVIKSPSALIEVAGYTDILAQQHQLDLLVVPAIGGALPAIAYLSGLANPVTAIGLFILQSSIDDFDANIATLKYKLSGDWDTAEVVKQP